MLSNTNYFVSIAHTVILSDNCNFFRLTAPPSQSAPFPFPNCPPPPTGRADDSIMWSETIAKVSNIRVVNLAFSGATCNNTDFPRTHQQSFNGTVVDPDVTSQIQMYLDLKDPSIRTPATTVAAIFIGTNDLGFFLQVFRNPNTADILPPGVQITNEANCVVQQVQTLYNHGLRRFLIFETIPLQATGQYSANIDNGNSQPGAFLSAFMTQLVSANNALQAQQLAALQTRLPGSDIQIFPTFDFYAQRIANPKAFLGPNGTAVGWCNTNLGTCSDPQDFLFWDDLHPGPVANAQLGQAVVDFLEGKKI
ncbi:carbohydrate esterase family 16 protein [Sphaerobolus stellatus SS14]|nr:carbohydrate esterase family 16 protein [Sphaerobolus stellatus SS14]